MGHLETSTRTAPTGAGLKEELDTEGFSLELGSSFTVKAFRLCARVLAKVKHRTAKGV